MQKLPRIIQGGMGIGVSTWLLANKVSRAGQLGVVSSTGIGGVLARRLQLGDPDGSMRRALEQFPVPEIALRIIGRYYIPGGKPVGKNFRHTPMFTLNTNRILMELVICGNFVEVYLAKEGHDGLVGINLLEKVQMPHLASLYGAMLAGVDYILVGAGIPTQIPAILDKLAFHEKVFYRLQVEGAGPDDDFRMAFDPKNFFNGRIKTSLKRPDFLPIISLPILAKVLQAKASGDVNGFIVEGPTAGGHNAPPRGKYQYNSKGEPIYGERDLVDHAKMRELSLPFWLAGSYASPEKLREALEVGAAGIQVGSIFALCEESGLVKEYRETLRKMAFHGELDVFTDPLASTSGFPFKVANLPDSLADFEEYKKRPRNCDLGRLRALYKKDDGSIGYRCPGEPVAAYISKGGDEQDTVGRKCLCNALMANIGLAQIQRSGYAEQPLVTLGDDLSFIHKLINTETDSYSAEDAIDYLLGI